MTGVQVEHSQELGTSAVRAGVMTVARPITTVLCDLDGTLIDSRRDIALAFQHN